MVKRTIEKKIRLWSTTRVSIKAFFILIFINYLPDEIILRCKTFPDKACLFSKVYGIDISAKQLNSY